jgi:Leucine-rich repeat (LRR) protein
MLPQTVCIVLSVIPWATPFYVDPLFRSKGNIPQKCSHFKEMVVDCYGLELTAVPQNLRTDIELLQITQNRIRELHTDSFKRYRYLKYLYLDDNVIPDIENGTFAPLLGLEVIRLSCNGIDRVPYDLLQLPKMRKIYLDNNRLIPGGGFVGASASETLDP